MLYIERKELTSYYLCYFTQREKLIVTPPSFIDRSIVQIRQDP